MICDYCGNEITYKEIRSSISLKYKPVICKDCGTNYIPTFISKMLVSIFFLVPIFFIANKSSSTLIFIISFSIYLLMAFFFTPYIIKYKIG